MCSLRRLPVAKKHNFGQILTLGAPVPTPLLPMRAKFGMLEQTQVLHLCAKFRLDRFILSPSVGENPQFFAVFWTSTFSGVAHWQQSEKVEHGCTTTNLPLSNGIKIGSIFQRLHGEIGRTNSDVQKCDEQTDKQTKNSTFLAAPAACEIRAPPNLAR